MKPAERSKMLEDRLAEINTALAAYKDEIHFIKEGGNGMRIAKNGMRFIRPGELKNKQRKDEPKKQTARPLTAAQKRRIEELRKRVESMNRAMLDPMPKGAEIRG